MTAINYIGEHLWAGTLGHVLTIVSLVGSALATLAFLLGALRKNGEWTTLGRIAFRLHSVAVIGIVVTLFTMLFNHWFEYDYVWKHSNLEMPLRYIASCFWEGQEGSFLLWTFWHMVLGNILIFRAKEWEPHVMTIIALVQVFLATMLLGMYVNYEFKQLPFWIILASATALLFAALFIKGLRAHRNSISFSAAVIVLLDLLWFLIRPEGEIRIGSSPFLLTRQLEENLGLPWTGMASYLTAIPQFADGRGLNPLLQNYWMVIHPPTLFLGFASTLVPFAYAIAGLWRGDKRGWIAPALPWTFFGVMILGTGVLMGGAWAYEALSFGGFWAWDPVENASLVPWLTLVGTGHLLLVNKHKETSLFSAFMLALTTFLLVLYSTFLTRSGVLGDTSVHSFTGDGMLPGLVFFLLFFVGLSTMMLLPDKGQRRFYALISLVLLVIGLSMEIQVQAILLFGVISVGTLITAYRKGFASADAEESLWSREFWIFIGSLVLLLSAVQITFTTSIPVFNLLLEPFAHAFTWLGEKTGLEFFTRLATDKMAPPGQPIAHFNKWQVPFAFVVTILVAFTQYLRWKDSDMKKFRKQLLLSVLIAGGATALAVVLLDYTWSELTLVALFFSTAFAAVANIAYIPKVLKGSLKNAGPSVAHTGFALVLLGALISTSRKDEISRNSKGMDLRLLNKDFNNSSDILLFKGDTVRMGEHYVEYHGKRQDGVNLYYGMDYFAVVPQDYRTGDTVRVGEALFIARDDHHASRLFLTDQPAHWQPLEQYSRRELWHARDWSATRPGERLFALEPIVQQNEKFGNVAEPSTKHWPGHDLYTHVRYADLTMASDSTDDDWMPDRLYDKQLGDTIVTPTSVVIIDSVYTVSDSVTRKMLGGNYVVYATKLRIRDLYRPDRWFEARPVLIYSDGQPVAGKAAEVEALRIKYSLATVDGNKVGINVAEAEFVVMQAIIFPGINILWSGCVLMFLGTFMAVRQRMKRGPSSAQ